MAGSLGIGFALALALAPARADENAAIFETGATMYTGNDSKSLAGAFGFFFDFRSEDRKGKFRPSLALQLDFASGKASIGAEKPASTVFGASFLGGMNVFLFKEGRFQPFIGGAGVLGYYYMKLPSPPTGVLAYTQSISYGFELSAGVDMRFGSADGLAWRLRGSYWSLSNSLAQQSGFQLTGFRLDLGWVF